MKQVLHRVSGLVLSLEEQVAKYGKEQIIDLLNKKLENKELGYNQDWGNNHMGISTLSNRYTKKDILFSIDLVNKM
jgi:hypothetical protein